VSERASGAASASAASEPGDETNRVAAYGARFVSSPKRVFATSFVVVSLLMASWSVASPLFGPSDEETQIAHAVAVVHGQLIGGTEQTVSNPYTQIRVPEVYAHIYAPCFALSLTKPASCASYAVKNPRKIVTTSTYVGRYPPLYYAIVGLPSLFVVSTTGMYMMRLVSCLLGALFLSLAIMAVFTWSRNRWLQLGVLLAATPTAVYFAGSVNPSGLEIMSAICLWVSALVLVREHADDPPRGLVALVGCSAVVLVLSRAISPVWAALILVLCIALGSPRELALMALRRRDLQMWALLVIGAGLFAIAWIYGAHALDLQPDATGPVPHDTQLFHLYLLALGDSPAWLTQMFSAIGWSNTTAPLATYVIWYAAIAFVVVLALVCGRARSVIVLMATVALVVVLPIVLTVSQVPAEGIGWEGRYTLPLAVGVPIIAVSLIGESSLEKMLRDRTATILCVGVWVANSLAFVEALRRYAVGVHGPLDYFGGPWSPPVGNVVATIWGVVAMGVFALLLRQLVSCRRPSPLPQTIESRGKEPNKIDRNPTTIGARRVPTAR
jgi:Predicted membrane protein (DUF2142)